MCALHILHRNFCTDSSFLSLALPIRRFPSNGLRWMFPRPGHRAQHLPSADRPRRRSSHVLAELQRPRSSSCTGNTSAEITASETPPPPADEQQLHDRLVLQDPVSSRLPYLQHHLLERLHLNLKHHLTKHQDGSFTRNVNLVMVSLPRNNLLTPHEQIKQRVHGRSLQCQCHYDKSVYFPE